MQTTVAIVGGGLAGLFAGSLLQTKGVDFKILEARQSVGGRILTEDGFDLGPSWFWPEMQPQLMALVRDLGLETFPQHNDGDVLIERMSRERPWRYRATHQEPQTLRFVGGTETLVKVLARQIPRENVLIETFVKHMTCGPANVMLTIAKADGSEDSIIAEQVIAAVPPRLLAQISFSPIVGPATVQRWKETATWIASAAKFFAIYDRPFWRNNGLSGTAQSLVGPLAEIHDAALASGKAALMGFVSVGADMRASLGETALAKSCIEQLARLYGQEALQPRATLFKDWAADRLTASAADRSVSGYPKPSSTPWVTGAWQEYLSLAGSETSATEPGYMAGAVSAAGRAVETVLHRLKSPGEKPK